MLTAAYDLDRSGLIVARRGKRAFGGHDPMAEALNVIAGRIGEIRRSDFAERENVAREPY